MNNPRIPPQVVRILLLTAFIIGSYVTARAFLTPSSFGNNGWYRADALPELASRQPKYAGRKACDECHSDQVLVHGKHEHKTISCETCHGPLLAHADNPEPKITKPDASVCLRCHLENPAKPQFLKQITLDKHYTGQACTECHSPHQPNEVP